MFLQQQIRMETTDDYDKGAFGVLPQELLVEVLNRIDVFDLRQLDATNIYWRQLIRKNNFWQICYRGKPI